MKIYKKEDGTIIIDGEKTALLASKEPLKINSDIKVEFTAFNILADNENRKSVVKSFEEFLDKGTLFPEDN